jgi:hypothetical protein
LKLINFITLNKFPIVFILLNIKLTEMNDNIIKKSDDHTIHQSNELKSIILGLFVLIGFIILVYAVFTAAVGQTLASVADTVFVAALIGSFTLVATIVGRGFLKK